MYAGCVEPTSSRWLCRARLITRLSATIVGLGCAPVSNYDDPSGPRFAENYSTAEQTPASALTVATFNIQFANQVARAIQEIDDSKALREARVLLLQEMDAEGTDRIARHFGYNYVYYPASKHQGKDFGNAVLSRWPIVDDAKLILPYRNPSNGRLRIAVAATLATPEGELVAYSVHNETPWLGPRARLEQVKTIRDHASEHEPPLIVGGDFNTLEKESIEATQQLFERAGYVWATRTIRDGTQSPVGSFSLDHMFVKGEGFEVLSADTQSTRASDHQPLWVELSLWSLP